jgi:hypothetical protein
VSWPAPAYAPPDVVAGGGALPLPQRRQRQPGDDDGAGELGPEARAAIVSGAAPVADRDEQVVRQAGHVGAGARTAGASLARAAMAASVAARLTARPSRILSCRKACARDGSPAERLASTLSIPASAVICRWRRELAIPRSAGDYHLNS